MHRVQEHYRTFPRRLLEDGQHNESIRETEFVYTVDLLVLGFFILHL